jgi:hypothetical protein
MHAHVPRSRSLALFGAGLTNLFGGWARARVCVGGLCGWLPPQQARTTAQTQAKAAKFVKVKSAEANAESKALQGQGIARQRAAIVQGRCIEGTRSLWPTAAQRLFQVHVAGTTVCACHFCPLFHRRSVSSRWNIPHSVVPDAVFFCTRPFFLFCGSAVKIGFSS